MMNGWKIGLPIAAMVFALALIAEAQIGVWQSTATGVTTGGTAQVDGALSAGSLNSTELQVTSIGAADEGKIGFYLASLALFGGDDGVRFFTSAGSAVAQIDANGYVLADRINTAPLQPGFLAYNSASDGLIDGEQVDFDTEVYDTAANFAADTFTAPVTGVYQFCATVGTKGATSEVSAQLVAGGQIYGMGLVDGSTATAFISGCALVPLTASQTAAIHVGVSTGTVDVHGDLSSVHQTHFSGRLVP